MSKDFRRRVLPVFIYFQGHLTDFQPSFIVLARMLAIKLSRFGKKKQPTYRVIVLEKTKDPWGDYLENLGFYNPRTQPKTIELKIDRIKHWISVGAQPTPTVHNLLVSQGIIEAPKKKASKISKKRVKKIETKKQEKEKSASAEATADKPAEAPVEPKTEEPKTEEPKVEEKPVEEKPKEEKKPPEEEKTETIDK